MSDNGPYTQPPQYPGGEGNNSGGQQPYGGYGQPGPGDPNAQYPGGYGHGGGYPSGGQPGYPGGQPDYQQGAYGTGPQYQQPPPDQQMYQGGGGQQPPYGAPPVGYGPPKKSSAGLWIVIAGGAVILVLVVAVVVMLLRNGGEEPPPVAEGGNEQGTEQGGGEADPEEDGGGGAPKGEAPYALPEDACKALSESQYTEYGADEAGRKNLSDQRSDCSWTLSGDDNGSGTLRIEYTVPYGGSDSVEGAKSDFKDAVKSATDEESSYLDRKVIKQQDADFGQEAKLVFSEEKSVGNRSVGVLLIRQDNVNIKVDYSMSASFLEENAPAPLEFSDVEKTTSSVGELALDHLGA